MKDINEIPEGASWNALKALNGEFLRLESFKVHSKVQLNLDLVNGKIVNFLDLVNFLLLTTYILLSKLIAK